MSGSLYLFGIAASIQIRASRSSGMPNEPIKALSEERGSRALTGLISMKLEQVGLDWNTGWSRKRHEERTLPYSTYGRVYRVEMEMPWGGRKGAKSSRRL